MKIKFKILFRFLFIFPATIMAFQANVFAQSISGENDVIENIRKKINHIIIIYQENWSFDGLYGKFPGSNNLDSAGEVNQVDKKGKKLEYLPDPYIGLVNSTKIDKRFTEKMPVKPYDLSKYIQSVDSTGDLTHRFYTEQIQIDGGRMDKFVSWSQNGGLVLSYFDASNYPEGKLAKEFTLCDHFFHSAFGGSVINHFWFIAAATPQWKNPPKSYISQPDTSKPGFSDKAVTPESYIINSSYSINHPHPSGIKDSMLVPNIDLPTIGDRLNEKNISWKWYSGGWNDALNGKPDKTFQFHHQPFTYFSNYKDGSEQKKAHLNDETDMFEDIRKGTLPSVSFVKPLGKYNEHPEYATIMEGQLHVDSLVRLIRESKYWNDCVIIITYDENGGRWDHVPPPVIDRWGPGTRVPTIIVSPFAKKGFIDKTSYETVSILKFIETKYQLQPLSSRDKNANGLLNAFQFK